MKSILYVMHVDWNWIKQRPHYIAEELSNYFRISVVCKSERRNASLVDNKTEITDIVSLPNIPMQRFKPVRRLNRYLRKRAINLAIRTAKPDFIWLTHPTMLDLIPKSTKCPIVYDCMDDALGFQLTGDIDGKKMLELEKALIRRAVTVLATSEHLAKVISKREECGGKIALVRNAFGGSIIDDDRQFISEREDSVFRIGYFGTVAEWFDFDALASCLEQIPELVIDVAGPLQNASPIEHDRLRLLGPIPHESLAEFVKTCDCMIMPFKLTELIRSVDPVKLYEYINFGKPIITVEYDEIRRFEPFVSFYSDRESLLAAIKGIMSNPRPKYTQEQRSAFLNENSWKQRVERIVGALSGDDPTR